MDGLNSSRKRKRPSYLEDFYQTLVEEQVPASKKKVNSMTNKIILITYFPQVVTKDESTVQDCSLCGSTEASSAKLDLMDTTESSKFTFSDVLNKLFNEELSPSVTKHEFSRGFLCAVCKGYVGDLDRLQHEVVDVKRSIISTFKKKKKETMQSIPDTTVTEPSPKKKQDTTSKDNSRKKEKAGKKKVQKKTEDEVYIIESLKEKKGQTFLVKWENYPEEQNTWEPRKSIPSFILKVVDSFSLFFLS